MSQLVLDENQSAQVNGLQSAVQVFDLCGTLIGYLVSKEKYEKLVYAWAMSQVADEELERRAQEPGDETTFQEILERLPKS